LRTFRKDMPKFVPRNVILRRRGKPVAQRRHKMSSQQHDIARHMCFIEPNGLPHFAQKLQCCETYLLYRAKSLSKQAAVRWSHYKHAFTFRGHNSILTPVIMVSAGSFLPPV
jgi:hypothetical protein